MSELLKKYRAHFNKQGQQEEFLLKSGEFLSIGDIATLCGCSERTVRDWKREKFHMEYLCLEKICKKLSFPVPAVKKVEKYAHTSRAGSSGARAVIEKYGRMKINENERLKQWRLWWEREGRYREDSVTTPLPVHLPKRSVKLAEFVGVMLGDGGISTSQLSITLNKKDDLGYSKFVATLCEHLFKISPSIMERPDCNTVVLVISRVNLVKFLTEDIGLVQGNKIKNNVRIPAWILKNKSYRRACVRGLFDTDGSIYKHSYVVKGKTYQYKKICFSSASPGLLSDIKTILEADEITTYCHSSNVTIQSDASVRRFFDIISSNNTKHLKRWGE